MQSDHIALRINRGAFNAAADAIATSDVIRRSGLRDATDALAPAVDTAAFRTLGLRATKDLLAPAVDTSTLRRLADTFAPSIAKVTDALELSIDTSALRSATDSLDRAIDASALRAAAQALTLLISTPGFAAANEAVAASIDAAGLNAAAEALPEMRTREEQSNQPHAHQAARRQLSAGEWSAITVLVAGSQQIAISDHHATGEQALGVALITFVLLYAFLSRTSRLL